MVDSAFVAASMIVSMLMKIVVMIFGTFHLSPEPLSSLAGALAAAFFLVSGFRVWGIGFTVYGLGFRA